MADTFGVAIHVTDTDLQFVVHVPSDINSEWSDPETFQRLAERVVWDRLDRDAVLRDIAAGVPAGESVSLGTVTLEPDGTVVEHTLDPPTVASELDAPERGRSADSAESTDATGPTDSAGSIDPNVGSDDA